jgi:hypothetical protein
VTVRLPIAILLCGALAACAGAKDGDPSADPGGSASAAPSTDGPQVASSVGPLGPPGYGVPLSVKSFPDKAPDDAADGHPRLWIREADLPRLRAWARPSNPVWANGVAPRLADVRAKVDAGDFEKKTDCASTEPYCESFAELLAFGSLVDPDPAVRKADAARARKILIPLLERIDRKAPGDPMSDPALPTYNRSRWAGEAFALSVDWLYPHLTPADRALARRVFLRWSEALLDATTTENNHPEPKGVLADPKLVADMRVRRYALNNYYAAHARNLALMALALDPTDDPEDQKGAAKSLRGYLANAIGAWWYVADRVLRDDARGGISPEGAQYGFQTLAYYAQIALALRTAGKTDAALFPRGSPPVDLGDNPFWAEVLPATLHLVTPGRVPDESGSPAHQAASWGDDQRFALGDGVDLWATWGLEAALRGDGTRLEAARWVIRNLPSPDQAAYMRRVRGDDYPRPSILHFMITDPDAPPARDPRSSIPLVHRGDGLGWVLARTGWDERASFFGAHAGWIQIDHQHGDGGDFFLYRKGEFLTKERAGWGTHFEMSDLHNVMSLENVKPSRGGDRREMVHARGSQWVLSPSGDPKPLGVRAAPDVVHASWDLTPLYNSTYEEVMDVEHASRSLTWLAPDTVVVVDRARSKVDGRFRRVFFQLPAVAEIKTAVATARTPKGQTLRIEALLPAGARLTSERATDGGDPEKRSPDAEPMKAFLRVEPASSAGKATTFLHVLTAADAGGKPVTPRVVAVEGKDVVGVEVGGVAVLAPVDDPALDLAAVTWTTVAQRTLITGLKRGGRYTVTCSGGGDARRCAARRDAGGSATVDDAGVLDLRADPK